MKHLLLYLVLFTPFSGLSQQTDATIVSQLNRDWIASYSTRDTATMARILADDFIMISPKGTKLSRTDIIGNVGSKDIRTTGAIDSASVRMFGNTALIVAYTHFSIQSNGQTAIGSNCYSDLYVKRNGVWKAVAAHVTVLTIQ